MLSAAIKYYRYAFSIRPTESAPSVWIHKGARELREVGRVFNEMADDLKEHERRRFEFMGGVVHDLRNPLSALQMASDVLAKESAHSPDAKARNTMHLVGRQISRLNHMIGSHGCNSNPVRTA